MISNLNLYPPDIFALLRALVVQTGTLDPAPLDGIVALGGIIYSSPSNINSTAINKRAFEENQEFMEMLVSASKEGTTGGLRIGDDMLIAQNSITKHSIAKRGIYTG